MISSRFKILVIALLVSLASVLSIYSSTYQKEGQLWKAVYQRQMLWIGLGVFLFLFVSRFNYRRLLDFTYLMYACAVGLLLFVFLLGIVRLGAQRWISLAWFNFQPSEIAKLIIVVFLARYFSNKSTDDFSLPAGKFGLLRGVALPFIFVAIPMVMIIEQPDLGSGVMVLFIFAIMLFLAGVKLRYLALLLSAALASLPVFWHFLRDYQKDRIMVFLNPNIDPLGAGYTVIQSKIAIGSGGLFGKGWMSGTQSQFHFLPESHTDFIFATFAEEWGFLGAGVLLLFYYLLIREALAIANRTGDHFGRLLALGISFMLGIQVFVNISMNFGLSPVVGLPLPLMSYGGSSVFVTFIALGILVSIDRRRAC